MREIIRSDNEGDMTYFVEYYLELLVRALDGTRMEEAERLQSQLESERKMALQPLKQPTVQYTQPHNYSAEAVARVIDNAESEQETAHVLQEERSTAPDPPTLPDGDASYRSSQSQAGSTQGDSENAALQAASQGRPCPPLLGLTDKLLDKIGKMLDTEISPFTSNQWAQTMGCNFVEGRNECREMFLLGLADRVPKNNVFPYTFNFSRADYTTAYQAVSSGRIKEPVSKKQWNHALSILEQAGIEYIDKTVAFIRECVEMGRTTFFLTDLCQYGSVQDKQCSVALQTLVDRGIIVLPAKKNKKHRIVMPSPKNSRKHSEGELLQAVYNGPRESDQGRQGNGEHGINTREGADTMTYQHYSPEFKARIVLQVLQGEKEVGEVAKEHNINPNLIRKWRTTFLEKASMVFEDPEKGAAKAKRKEESLEKKQRQMLSTIGQLTLERDFLQDAFRRTGRPIPRFNPEDE